MDFFGSLLPAHVNLKQPFTFESMDALEAWFDALARSSALVDIQLDSIYYSEWDQFAILGLNVVENSILRALQNRINAELA